MTTNLKLNPLSFRRAFAAVFPILLTYAGLGTSIATGEVRGAAIPSQMVEAPGRKLSADDRKMIGKAFDLFYGISTGSDRRKGIDLFRRAAKTGDPVAVLLYANARLHRGRIPKKLSNEVAADFARLLPAVEDAAERGDPDACLLLGETYQHGFTRPRNAAKASDWYRRSAQIGHVFATRILAESFYRKARANEGDRTEAVRWLRLGAERGDEWCASRLGLMGLADPDLGISELESVAFIRRSAARNHPEGLMALAFIYENGQGVSRDEVEAFRVYRRALEAGAGRALRRLDQMHEAGRADAEEMYLLGSMFRTGGALDQDLRQSFNWYSRAAEQGHILAAIERGWIATESRN